MGPKAKKKRVPLDAISINGESYFTVKQFALLTNRTEQSVRFLITKGNRVRKLLIKKIAGKPFVFANELTDFPFTVAGKSIDVYHYNKKGEIEEEEKVEV